MKQVVIENPVINSPFCEPGRHLKFPDEGITDEIIEDRQTSSYFVAIACIDDGHGPDDLLNLPIEVTGETKKDKAAKVSTSRILWVPAVNNHGGFRRWDFIEIDDLWDAMNALRGHCRG